MKKWILVLMAAGFILQSGLWAEAEKAAPAPILKGAQVTQSFNPQMTGAAEQNIRLIQNLYLRSRPEEEILEALRKQDGMISQDYYILDEKGKVLMSSVRKAIGLSFWDDETSQGEYPFRRIIQESSSAEVYGLMVVHEKTVYPFLFKRIRPNRFLAILSEKPQKL